MFSSQTETDTSVATFDPEEARPDSIQTVLVVDDVLLTARFAGNILSEALGVRIVTACDGVQALAMIRESPPSIVLTDLRMPNMSGLELVEEIRSLHPSMPVIIMTASGSEDVAIEALHAGASSYVPKSRLCDSLVPIAERLLSRVHNERRRTRALDSMRTVRCRFVLENDPDLVGPLIDYLREQMMRMKVCSEHAMMRIAVALEEALLNGIYHGNLEISSELKEDGDAFRDLANTRRYLDPWQARRIRFDASIDESGATFVIRDGGEGFDVSALPDPTDPENMLMASGRGLLLIRTFMSEVFHNATGNQITMVYRRK